MEEKKTLKDKVFYLLVGLLLLIIVYSYVGDWRSGRYWSEDWMCSSIDAARDFGESYGCALNNCEFVPNKFNTEIKKCLCAATNETVYTYCSHQIRHRAYEGDIDEIEEFVNSLDASANN